VSLQEYLARRKDCFQKVKPLEKGKIKEILLGNEKI